MTVNISPLHTSGVCGMRVSFTEFSQAPNIWWIIVWAHTWCEHGQWWCHVQLKVFPGTPWPEKNLKYIYLICIKNTLKLIYIYIYLFNFQAKKKKGQKKNELKSKKIKIKIVIEPSPRQAQQITEVANPPTDSPKKKKKLTQRIRSQTHVHVAGWESKENQTSI